MKVPQASWTTADPAPAIKLGEDPGPAAGIMAPVGPEAALGPLHNQQLTSRCPLWPCKQPAEKAGQGLRQVPPLPEGSVARHHK